LARAKTVKPKARFDELVVSEVEEEVLVYDRARQEAHSLNPAAALVWRNCDGKKSVTDLALLLNSKLGLPPSEASVWGALERLEEANLLAEPITADAGDGSSRRDFMKKVGLATAAAGVASVITIGVPAAFAANSCVPHTDGCGGGKLNIGQTCTAAIECCSCLCQQNAVTGGGFTCQPQR
jgi:coenzyme PQQ synthesis protein D (PqqD)